IRAVGILGSDVFDKLLILRALRPAFPEALFFILFVKKLRHAQTEWPEQTVQFYKERLRLQSELVNDWIDLQFVAKRTGCIAKLIYYPLGIIALFILAGITVFADYPPSLSILVTQWISFTIVIGCAIVLWREAGPCGQRRAKI